MGPSQIFNQELSVSCDNLSLYRGEMTLVPHQGDVCFGTGTIDLACGGVIRHLRVAFERTDGEVLPDLLRSTDGKYGRGTSMMRLPLSDDFFVFVTSGAKQRALVGESDLIMGGSEQDCTALSLYLLNGLIPGHDMNWILGDWRISSTRTACAYDLTRLSRPSREINLTHRLTVTRQDQQPFRWSQVESIVRRFLTFLSSGNCSRISAPVIYGHGDETIKYFRFETPPRSLPTNRRSLATDISQNDLNDALSLFLKATEGTFRASILDRAIEWQILAERVMYDSLEQALFTVQMLLEMLSFVMLVEDAAILGEDGYGKLPASDRITLLCGHSSQRVSLDLSQFNGLDVFCAANCINNVGELITALRNKLIHPTKKNREYLDRVPQNVRFAAIYSGLQISSLAMLKSIDYKGSYFDIIDHESRVVPWA